MLCNECHSVFKKKTFAVFVSQNHQVSPLHPAYSKLFSILVSRVDKNTLHENEEIRFTLH